MTSIKLVFVVIYSAVLGTNDKTNFDNLATAAAKMVLDMKKLEAGIGLIVTKAPNFGGDDGDELTDEDNMTTVRGFLNMYISDQTAQKQGPKADTQMIDKKIAFANAILKGNKIGVMPTPSQCGPLVNNQRQVAASEKLRNLMSSNIQSVQTTSSDFGFPLSPESINKLEIYKEDVNQKVKSLKSQILLLL